MARKGALLEVDDLGDVHKLQPIKVKRVGSEVPFLLCSDFHLGHPKCNVGAIIKDLQWARANSARVFITGDICDAIVPGTDRRHHPTASAPGAQDVDALAQVRITH